MNYTTQLKVLATAALIGLALALYAYIDAQRTINYYRRKRVPLIGRPPKPTWRQKVLNFILFLPPANW